MGAADNRLLVELGLTGYEASAYVALIQRGDATATEVARLASLPRQRIYDVLDGLVAQGFATVKPGRPARYAAAPPEEALWRTLERRRAAVDELADGISATVARLQPAYRDGRGADDPLRFVELLRDPLAIARRFAELEQAAEREILVFTRPPYAVEPAANAEGLALLERRVEARSIYEQSIYDDPERAEAVRAFIAAGEQARVVPELPLKLVVVDERIVAFTLEDPVAVSDGLTILVVEHASLARLFKLTFESVWSSAAPFE